MIESLGHYKMLDRIGAGGMGEVYRARDTRLGRTVAIKILKREVAADTESRERLFREARAAATLSHPNIATLYELGEDQGELFLVFEFVPGDSLRIVIGGRPLNPRRAIDLGVQISDALADAHAAGIVHRDIKPDNVIVTPKGNAKILDFGLAKWTAGGAERDHVRHQVQTVQATQTTETASAPTTIVTSPGTGWGTVAYMSPEQALGQPVDERTDIFSLGTLLFEMLTGRLPFTGPTTTAIALQIVQAEAPAPSSINRSLPGELDAIVAKALAKRPDRRYSSAATMAAELRAIGAALETRSAASDRVAGPATPGRSPRSRWSWRNAALLVFAATVGGAAWVARGPIARVWRHNVARPPAPVLAVIPLELANNREDDRYFADGLTEDLIMRLGQTPGLRVLGRSATRAYRERSPRDLARELGATVVLAGSVRPSGDAVKISLELIDPSDSTDLWTGQYTREVKDIFAVQAQVAEEVSRALRVRLQPTASAVRAAARLVDSRAYEAYLRGRQAAALRRLDEARRYFEQAIHDDDGLAEAHAGLAEVLHLEALIAATTGDPARRVRLKRAAERAYELAPDLPQANLAQGLAAETLPESLGYMKKAIGYDPSYSEAYHQIGDQIEDFDPERAIRFYRKALELDPRMDVNHADITNCLSMLGRFDEARHEVESTNDAFGWKSAVRVTLDLDQGRYDAALNDLDSQAFADAPVFVLGRVTVLRMGGRPDAAYRAASTLVKKNPSYCEARALLAALTAERGQGSSARRLVAPALKAASAPDAAPSAIRCAVISAAALNDARQAAALLRRIAGDERLLRYWPFEISGTTGSKLLRRSVFPWSRVYDQPDFAEARNSLRAAYVSMRQRIELLLKDVTP